MTARDGAGRTKLRKRDLLRMRQVVKFFIQLHNLLFPGIGMIAIHDIPRKGNAQHDLKHQYNDKTFALFDSGQLG